MYDIESYRKQLNNEVNELKGVIKNKQENIDKLNSDIIKLNARKEENIQKKLILQEACKKARELSADWFAMISTNGVKTILGDNLEVKIILGDKNGVPTSDFVVHATYDDYETITDPTEEDGGGVADIVSLTNFLTMNIVNKDYNAAPLILDEPTKFVSAGHADDVGSFLSKISKEFGKQIIMVTHAQETKEYADKIFHVSLNEKGTSEVISEKNNN